MWTRFWTINLISLWDRVDKTILSSLEEPSMTSGDSFVSRLLPNPNHWSWSRVKNDPSQPANLWDQFSRWDQSEEAGKSNFKSLIFKLQLKGTRKKVLYDWEGRIKFNKGPVRNEMFPFITLLPFLKTYWCWWFLCCWPGETVLAGHEISWWRTCYTTRHTPRQPTAVGQNIFLVIHTFREIDEKCKYKFFIPHCLRSI